LIDYNEGDLLLADGLDELLLPLVFLLEELAQVVLGGEESLPAPVKSVQVEVRCVIRCVDREFTARWKVCSRL
jgi:hypothetical protein